jgi:hypothetical protein
MGLILALAKLLGFGALVVTVFYVGSYLLVLAAAAIVAVLLVLVLSDGVRSVIGDY